MLRFIGNTLKIFFGIIFIVLPISLIGILLLFMFFMLCIHIAGGIGVILGFALLASMGVATLMN